MKHEFKKVVRGQTELSVELTQAELKNYIEEAESEIGKNAELDGFRRGKVPKSFLKEHIDSSQILELAMEMAVRGSLNKIITDEKLDVLNTSDFRMKENSVEKLAYSANLVLFPDFNLPNVSRFKIKRVNTEVSQKEIDETLETIRASRAKLYDKAEPAQTGDRLEVDFEVKADGKIIEGGLSKNHPLIIGGKNFMPGFEEELVGMKKGEEKNFSLIAPPDYYQKSIAGKKLDFLVKIGDVKKVQLPELNDDFAASVGKFGSLEQLSRNAKEGIRQEKELNEKQKNRLEILEQIIKTTDIKTPEVLVDVRLDEMVGSLDDDLHKNGLELGPYLARLGKTQDDLKKDWRKEAEKQIKMNLVIHKIIKANGIEVSSEEAENAFNLAVQTALMRGEIENPADLNTAQIRENVAEKIINEKAFDWLEKMCVV